MLGDIVQLSTDHLDRLILALSRGTIGPGATPSQVRKLEITDQPERILVWVAEALTQFGSMGGVLAVLRLLRQDRGRPERQGLPSELILTGPMIPLESSRETRVVVREIFETVERSILIVGYAFHGSDAIFEPLAQRMGERADLAVRMVVNIHPQWGQTLQQTIERFTRDFLRSTWPFHPRPRIYYLPTSMEVRGAIRSSVHAKVIVADWETVFLGSANFTGAAFHRNIEAGVCFSNARLGSQLSTYFEQLIAAGELMPLPLE